jgi:Protein of unknown function (DUF1552)
MSGVSQQIAHIADDQHNLCAPARGEVRKAAYRAIESSLSTKADLVPALKAAFAYCDGAYEALTDGSSAEMVAGQRRTRFGMLNWNVWHTWEHYGNIVVYLRMKGIVPPSSEKARAASTPVSSPATRARRRVARRSILDLVALRTTELVSSLGPSDRRKVDEYLRSVREIERRIQLAEQDTREVSPGFDIPSGVPVSFAEYASLMFDMQAVAFQADLTRVSTLMIGREGSLRTYPEIGVPDPHHPPPITGTNPSGSRR